MIESKNLLIFMHPTNTFSLWAPSWNLVSIPFFRIHGEDTLTDGTGSRFSQKTLCYWENWSLNNFGQQNALARHSCASMPSKLLISSIFFNIWGSPDTVPRKNCLSFYWRKFCMVSDQFVACYKGLIGALKNCPLSDKTTIFSVPLSHRDFVIGCMKSFI